MSHYNSNSTNSWQNRSNNSSGTSSLFGTPHDLLNYSSSQQLSTNNSSLTGSNNSSLVNNVPNSANVYNPAASLLAQFAVNSVNFGNLAANLPAALVNANVLAAANLGAVANGSTGGYQWHASQPSNTQLNSRNSDQRIVSIGNSSNNNNSGYKPSNIQSKNTSSSSSSNTPAHESVRPLMEIDTIRRNQINAKLNSSSASKASNSTPSNNKNGHSDSRDRDRDRDRTRERDRDRDRERDRDRDRRSNSTSNNKHSLTITTTNLSAAANNLAAGNPLAQALLNQLAAQSTNSNANNSALVAALAVANAAVSAQQQKQQKTVSPPRNNKSSSIRKSRSPSSTSNRNNNSTHKPNTNSSSSSSRNNTGSSSQLNKSSSNSSSHNKQHSKSPVSSSAKRLSSSNIQTSSSSSSTQNKPSSSSSSSNRYAIKVPKYPLDALTNNVIGLKARYNQLYIPSDFIHVKNNWQNSLPLNRTLKFNSRCLFHIMRKESHSIMENEAVFDPPDADHTWIVKVMLLAMPSVNELYKRSCLFAEDPSRTNDRLEHPSKVIQFLVGNKGKHELMALGGAWSASLDGPNPATNSQTLINTAVRTVKALTGIDLSPCTQWFRFLDIQYNRNEDFKTIILPTNSKVKEERVETADATSTSTTTNKPEATLLLDDEKDVETTVIFVPNIWSLMPNSIEYQKTVDAYKNFIENPPPPHPTLQQQQQQHQTPSKPSPVDVNCKSVEVESKPDNLEQQQEQEVEMFEEKQESDKILEDDFEDSKNGQAEVNSIEDLTKSLKAEYEAAHKNANGNNDEMDENDDSESKLEPTHYSKLDVKKMKVDELRTELMARDLDTRGLKGQLINRLKEALDTEQGKEEQTGDKTEDNETKQENQVEQSNGENSDIVYTHVNDCDIESFQIDEKDTELTEKDSNKAAQTAEEKANSEKQRRAEKIARIDREKMYKLPQIPHLIVHPSRTAKNAKFECQLVSLSHLLDYRKDDNKESSFEVSIFAEYFNEMLIRDFGFTIYKHLLTIRTEKDKELFALAATTNNHKRKLSLNEPEEDSKRSKTDDKMDTETKEDKPSTTIQLSKPKPKTVYPDLLLSFIFFDTNRTNYINEKDLEDLLLCIGLSLSRSKIKALISKLSFKDNSLNYRTLTDKLPKEILSDNENNVHFSLPNDDEIVSSIITYDKYMNRFGANESNTFNKDSGIIELNGSTIDVLNTIKSLNKSEQNALKLDQKLKDATEEIERLKTLNKTADRLKLRLSDELNDHKKKLREQLRTNKEIDDKYIRFKECLVKTKSQLNKVVDDVSDVLKRGQPNSNKKKSTLDDLKAKETNQIKTTESKVVNNEIAISANTDENQDINNTNMEEINTIIEESSELNTIQCNELEQDQSNQIDANSNECESHVDQIDEETAETNETNGISTSDI